MSTATRRGWAALRVTLGLLMLAGAATHFTNIKEGAMAHSAFISAMVATKYLWPILGAIELLTGVALVAGRLVPLALLVLAPVTINILCFHLSEPSPDGIGIAVFILALHVALAWKERAEFRVLLSPRHSNENATVQSQAHTNTSAEQVRGVVCSAFGLLMVTGGIMHFTIDPASWHLSFIDALKATGYMWALIGVVNIVAGAALVARRFVPLALLVLLPISTNVFLLHMANPGAGGIPIGVVLIALNLWLLWSHRAEYRALIVTRVGSETHA
jgi:hypothetical protein